jgi:hypothetical protein
VAPRSHKRVVVVATTETPASAKFDTILMCALLASLADRSIKGRARSNASKMQLAVPVPTVLAVAALD